MKAPVYLFSLLKAAASEGWRGYFIASFFSGLLKLISPRRGRIDSNLKLAYPEKSEIWRKDIRRRLYEHLAWLITEILVLQKEPARIFSWVENVENSSFIEKLIDEGKGAVILSSHFGNWELLGSWYGQMYASKGRGKFYALFQNTRDKDIAEMLYKYRQRAGIELLSKDTPVTTLVRLLKSGAHIATMPDVSWSGGINLPFMGQECTNTTGPAVLSMMASVPIIPIGIYRKAPFRHDVRFLPPLKIPDEKDRKVRLELLTLEVNRAIENIIAPQPEQWFWLHNRWKTYL